MKKNFLLLITLITVLHASTFAQKARFGIQAGPTMSNLVIKGMGEQETSDMKAGFTAGILVDKPINAHFIFQPAVNFVQKGQSANDYGYTSSTTLNYVEIPLNFLYRAEASKGFFAGAGPSIGIGINGKTKDGSEKYDIKFGNDEDKDDLKRMDFGANLVAGYLFGNGLQIAANFNKSFSNLIIGEAASDVTVKNNYFSVRVGYFFNSK